MRTFFTEFPGAFIGWLRGKDDEPAPAIVSLSAPTDASPVPSTSAYVAKRRSVRRRASGYSRRAEARM